MHSCYKLITGMTLVLLVAIVASVPGDEGQTLPSPYYLQDDVQYFPLEATEAQTAPQSSAAALGDLLFTDVVSVHFVGPGHPANPDGSLGGLVAGDDDGTEIRIYERYIVREARGLDGTTFRQLHAYETIGRIEQRIPAERPRR